MWIEKADLAENHLKGLPRFPFNGSVYVRDLNLAFNDVRSLGGDSFGGLQSGRIVLSYNELEEVGKVFPLQVFIYVNMVSK